MPSVGHFIFRTPRASRFRLASLTGLVLFALTSLVRGQDSLPKFTPPDSNLVKFTAELKATVRLEPDSGKLIPKFLPDGNSARTEINAAVQKLGVRNSSSSSSGGDSWSLSSRGNQLSVSAGFGRRHYNPYYEPVLAADPDAFYLQVLDHTKSRASVLVTAKEDRQFTARIEDRNGVFSFRFEQSKNGSVSCVELSPEFQFSAQAESFDQLAERHPEYVAQRLTPIFKMAGLGAAPTRYSPVVQRFVVNSLRPVDPERDQQFRDLIKPMDDDDFDQREQATKTLESKFEKWESEIKRAIVNTEFSAEVRSRLKKIFDANVDKTAQAFQSLAAKGRLTENPSYLLWLLTELKSSADGSDQSDMQYVIAQLEQLTGKQGIGDDLDQWQKVVNQDQPVSAGEQQLPQVAFETLLETEGTLDDISDVTENLLRLDIEQDRLTVDKDYWKKKLGGKSVAEVTNEVREFVKQKSLPSNWFDPGGGQYPQQTVEFPQVVFERLTADLKMDPEVEQRMSAYSRYIRNTGNRQFEGQSFVGALSVHNQDRVQLIFNQRQQKLEPVKQIFLKLELQETSDQERELFFFDDFEGNLVVSIRFGALNSELRLVQQSEPDSEGNQVYLFDARGNELAAYQAPSFAELKTKADNWENAEQLFNKFGIHFGSTSDKN